MLVNSTDPYMSKVISFRAVGQETPGVSLFGQSDAGALAWQMDGCKDADPQHIPEYVEVRGRRKLPFAAGPVTASATSMRSVANTTKKRAMISAHRHTREATGKLTFGCGGYLRWRIGLAFWQDDVDRPGAHGVNSLSG